MKYIYERISQAVSNSKLSYRELSKATGIPSSTLQRYASGQTEKIPIDKIEAIAKATKVSAAYLMGWEENSNTNTGVNNGIIGNHNSHNVVGLDANGEIEKEILNICKKLDIKRKNALLTRAYELLEGQ